MVGTEADSDPLDSGVAPGAEIGRARSQGERPEIAPWMAPDAFPGKPESSPYGFMRGNEAVPCDWERLLHQVKEQSPHLVWVPEFPRLVPPREVPALRGHVLKREPRGGLVSLTFGLFFLSFGAFLHGPGTLRGIFHLLVGGVFLAVGFTKIVRGRSGRPLSLPEVEAFRFNSWIQGRPWQGAMAIGIMIVAVYLAEILHGLSDSVERLRLLKGEAFGQCWRLGTSAFTHGPPLHFIINLLAFAFLGWTVEALAGKWRLFIVFALSALGTSLLSMCFLTGKTCVGSSGAILGLLGFLIVLGVKKRKSTGRVFRFYAVWLLAIAAIGIAGYRYIDYAGHLGGLVSGVLAGIILIPRRGAIPLRDSLPVRICGAMGLAAITVAWVWTMVRLI